jgi:hypothetical protein
MGTLLDDECREEESLRYGTVQKRRRKYHVDVVLRETLLISICTGSTTFSGYCGGSRNVSQETVRRLLLFPFESVLVMDRPNEKTPGSSINFGNYKT